MFEDISIYEVWIEFFKQHINVQDNKNIIFR